MELVSHPTTRPGSQYLVRPHDPCRWVASRTTRLFMGNWRKTHCCGIGWFQEDLWWVLESTNALQQKHDICHKQVDLQLAICQFLGSFKCLLRLHLSFFIGKTQVLEQKHPNLSPLCLHLESEDIFWLNWLWSCPSQRGGGCVLPGQIVESSPAGTQVVGFLPHRKSHRFFLRGVFHVFSFAEERIPWPGIDHEGTSGHCTRGIMNQPYTSWWYPVTSVHQFNLHVRFTCIRFVCKINYLEITGP